MSSSKTPKMLVFDFDGTIANSMDKFIEVTDILSKKYLFKSSKNLSLKVLRDHTLTDLILHYFQIPWYKIPFIVRDFKNIIRQTPNNTQISPDMTKVLLELKKRNWRLSLLTSSSAEIVNPILKKSGLENLFEFQITEASIYHKEKNLNRILKKYNLEKSEIWYFGDELRDIRACHRLGVRCVAVTWGFSSKKLLETLNPDLLFAHPNQILKYFSEIQKT